MITKQKTVLIVALTVAAILSVAGMDYVSGQESTINRTDEPQDSPAEAAIQQRADVLFAEQERIYAEGVPLKAKYDERGIGAMTEQEIEGTKRISKHLKNVKDRICQLNADSRALITISQEDKDMLQNAMIQIRESDIPYTGMYSDWNAEAIAVGFETQVIADQYAPEIDEIIDVSFYTQISGSVVLDACSSLTSNCDPLLGEVKITTEFNDNATVNCSYSTAVHRDGY